jgi:hypothetical protein
VGVQLTCLAKDLFDEFIQPQVPQARQKREIPTAQLFVNRPISRQGNTSQ